MVLTWAETVSVFSSFIDCMFFLYSRRMLGGLMNVGQSAGSIGSVDGMVKAGVAPSKK